MSTLQRTPPPDPVESPSPTSEPAIIRRQREALHEILRLVSERAAAEDEVGRKFASSDAAADQEYQKARQALIEKFEAIKEGYRKEDEEARRAIVDAAITGDTEAKAEFARASRRIAADFDGLRDQTKTEYLRAKSAAMASAACLRGAKIRIGPKSSANAFAISRGQ